MTNVSLDGLHPVLMRPRVEALIADPEFIHAGMSIVSAFRSDALQALLYQAAIKEYGSAQAAGKWVAPPGRSRHGPRVDGCGMAIDISIPGETPWKGGVKGQFPDPIEAKANAICAKHGLASPMDWEDWHFEPIPNWSPRTAAAVVVPPKECAAMFNPPAQVVDVLMTPDGHGCWMVGPDGAIYTVGTAPYLGGMNTGANVAAFAGKVAAKIEPRDDGHAGYQIRATNGRVFVP